MSINRACGRQNNATPPPHRQYVHVQIPRIFEYITWHMGIKAAGAIKFVNQLAWRGESSRDYADGPT